MAYKEKRHKTILDMSAEGQAISVGDSVELQNQKDPLGSKIGDEEVHILNPFYRLRNSKNDYVLAQGVTGLESERVHRATGVVLALCNGKRTVADIARITRPLVKIADDAEATKQAKAHVKAIIHTMSQTPEERKGQPRKRSKYPATTVLLAKADYDQKFGRTKFVTVEYHANDFLPKDPSEMSAAPHHNSREAVPVTLLLHPTSECSTDCRYCFLGRRKVNLLPKERVLSLIEEAAAIRVMAIDLTGGDILLYPYLKDVLMKLCKYKFLPTILSTKSFLSKEKAKILAENASILLSMQFSIDSTVGDVADYLVRAKDFCQRILTSIDNALEVGLRVEAKAVITPYNILTIPKLYRDLKKRGVSTIRLAPYFRSGFHHSDDLFNQPASYRWLQEQTEQLQQEFPDDVIEDLQAAGPRLEPLSPEARRKAWPKRLCCTAGRSSMMVCADGKVIPCEQMPETEEYFCGDVSHQSIQEVWNGDRLRELTYGISREKFKGQPCYDCEEWKECICQIGCCIRDLVLYHGSIYRPPLKCPKYDKSFIRTV